MRASVMLAGVPVEDRLVLDLAPRLRDAELADTAEVLEDACDPERRVLEDGHEEFAELRGVLLREVEWRRREGLT